MLLQRATESESIRTAESVGVQLTGNSRIGTFVQGLDPNAAEKLTQTLGDISRTLKGMQKGAELRRVRCLSVR